MCVPAQYVEQRRWGSVLSAQVLAWLDELLLRLHVIVDPRHGFIDLVEAEVMMTVLAIGHAFRYPVVGGLQVGSVLLAHTPDRRRQRHRTFGLSPFLSLAR